MKKILISLSIILAMSLSANAQMWLNLKAGGGLALASGSDGAKGGTAILSGLGYKHQLTKRLIAEGDVLFDIRSIEYLQNDD